jgi:hypothetical protein
LLRLALKLSRRRTHGSWCWWWLLLLLARLKLLRWGHSMRRLLLLLLLLLKLARRWLVKLLLLLLLRWKLALPRRHTRTPLVELVLLGVHDDMFVCLRMSVFVYLMYGTNNTTGMHQETARDKQSADNPRDFGIPKCSFFFDADRCDKVDDRGV